jgi:formylglycine-generating enzyme required for sulfatase activity/ABC-type cobalamin/Fe3+-siderophores transport system ATPase subunit
MGESEQINQDVAEKAKAKVSPSLPERPYKFLDYFETGDQPIFFGRDEEADALQNQITAHKLTVLFGQSGVGKTSLINAGVIPRLGEEGYISLYLRALREPAASIRQAALQLRQDATSPSSNLQSSSPDLCSFLERTLPTESRLVIFLDQFEEFFVRLGKATRAAFAEELAACLQSDPALSGTKGLDLRFVLSLRDDYLARLHSLSVQLPEDILLNRFCLENLNVEKARPAITQPAQAFKLRYEDELLETLLDDLEQEGDVEPPQLQIVCHKLYENLVDSGEWVEGSGRSGLLTLESYKELGGAEGILTSYLNDALAELPDDAARERAWSVLGSMITVGETRVTLTTQEMTQQKIAHELGLNEDEVEEVLAVLRDKRLIRWLDKEGAFELAHEYMLGKVWEWVSEEEAVLKRASDLLRRELSNYQKMGLLMGHDGLKVVSESREALSLSTEELDFVFRSTLAVGHEMKYWLERAGDGGVAVEGILKDELESAMPNTRANVAKVLGELVLSPALKVEGRFEGLGLDEAIAWLAVLLKDDYPNVRAAARKSLLKIGTEARSETFAQRSGQALAELRSNSPSEMILIPAGNFLMGDEKQSVHVDAFYIDKYPVTNAEYAKFVEATGHPQPPNWEEIGSNYLPDMANHPVVFVNWFDAQDYAAWAGKRLLTEAEWEKAARGTDGRVYPWGNEFNRIMCNASEAGIGGTTPVGKYSPFGDSPYKVCDMAGNVWEWTATDWAPGSSSKVQRGGSFVNRGSYARCAYRYLGVPEPRNPNVGFRCGMSASALSS